MYSYNPPSRGQNKSYPMPPQHRSWTEPVAHYRDSLPPQNSDPSPSHPRILMPGYRPPPQPNPHPYFGNMVPNPPPRFPSPKIPQYQPYHTQPTPQLPPKLHKSLSVSPNPTLPNLPRIPPKIPLYPPSLPSHDFVTTPWSRDYSDNLTPVSPTSMEEMAVTISLAQSVDGEQQDLLGGDEDLARAIKESTMLAASPSHSHVNAAERNRSPIRNDSSSPGKHRRPTSPPSAYHSYYDISRSHASDSRSLQQYSPPSKLPSIADQVSADEAYACMLALEEEELQRQEEARLALEEERLRQQEQSKASEAQSETSVEPLPLPQYRRNDSSSSPPVTTTGTQIDDDEAYARRLALEEEEELAESAITKPLVESPVPANEYPGLPLYTDIISLDTSRQRISDKHPSLDQAALFRSNSSGSSASYTSSLESRSTPSTPKCYPSSYGGNTNGDLSISKITSVESFDSQPTLRKPTMVRPVSAYSSVSLDPLGKSVNSTELPPEMPQGVMTANQFIDRDLLTGVSLGFTAPTISARSILMHTQIPNIISLPYGRCPPLHLQAPSWRHLLKLLARLSSTRIEPTLEAMAVTRSELKLRTVIQFVKTHHSSSDWRTILWFTIDHPVPPALPGAQRYINGDVSVLPFSYTLSTLPTLLRDGAETAISKSYTVPSTEFTPYPTLPINFPNLATYLQATLEESRRYAHDSSSGIRRLAKMVDFCYPDFDGYGAERSSSVGGLFKRVIGRGHRNGRKGRGGNEDTYELVTPFVPDEWGS